MKLDEFRDKRRNFETHTKLLQKLLHGREQLIENKDEYEEVVSVSQQRQN